MSPNQSVESDSGFTFNLDPTLDHLGLVDRESV
jgi:hypothetical protein